MKNKKMLFLNITALVLAVYTVFNIFANGGEYVMHTRSYFTNAEVTSFEMISGDDSVAVLKDAKLSSSGEAILTYEAKGRGSTEIRSSLNIHFHDGGDTVKEYNASFHVTGMGILVRQGDANDFSGFSVLIRNTLFLMILSVVIMLWEVYDMRKAGKFGYTMTALCGVSIFFSVILLFIAYKLRNNDAQTLGRTIAIFSEAGYQVLTVLFPFMLVMSVFLSFSNFWLIRHEGRRPVNTLGIIFGILWTIATLMTVGSYMTGFAVDLITSDLVRLILVYIVCYFECLFLATAFCAWQATLYTPAHDADFILILGCGIRKDGTLTPLLKGRAQAALDFETAQYQETGKHAIFVPSGGQGPDEVIPEEEAIANWLKEQGVPEERILIENKSSTTYENMKFSKEVIEKTYGSVEGKKIVFATTSYHIFRGYALARKCGYEAQGISAKTKMYFYPNAFLREFIGLLDQKKFYHIAFAAALAGFFSVLYMF